MVGTVCMSHPMLLFAMFPKPVWLSGVLISCCIFTNGPPIQSCHQPCNLQLFVVRASGLNFFMYCAATLGLTHRTLSVQLGSILFAMMICRYT